MTSTDATLKVIGIDVGGPRKGFHAVALDGGAYLDQKKTGDESELVEWCVHVIGARVIAVDAPCRWSSDGRARPAERQLMQQGIWCFSTPTQKQAVVHPRGYFGWMLRGEALYCSLEVTHRLYSGHPIQNERFCFETFPHAVTWHLRGGNALARLKRTQRAILLAEAGIQLPMPAGIDTIDAALCAYTAHLAAKEMETTHYGEPQTGFIVVPARRGP